MNDPGASSGCRPDADKRARLLPIPRGIHHPRQRVVRALQSSPNVAEIPLVAKRRHVVSLVSIHAGRTRRRRHRARGQSLPTRDRPRWTCTSRTTYPSRRMRSRDARVGGGDVIAATARRGQCRARRARRRIVATRLDRPPSRRARGGQRGVTSRVRRAPRLRKLATAGRAAKRKERKRKRVVVGNYNREIIFVSKCGWYRARGACVASLFALSRERRTKRGLDVLIASREARMRVSRRRVSMERLAATDDVHPRRGRTSLLKLASSVWAARTTVSRLGPGVNESARGMCSARSRW